MPSIGVASLACFFLWLWVSACAGAHRTPARGRCASGSAASACERREGTRELGPPAGSARGLPPRKTIDTDSGTQESCLLQPSKEPRGNRAYRAQGSEPTFWQNQPSATRAMLFCTRASMLSTGGRGARAGRTFAPQREQAGLGARPAVQPGRLLLLRARQAPLEEAVAQRAHCGACARPGMASAHVRTSRCRARHSSSAGARAQTMHVAAARDCAAMCSRGVAARALSCFNCVLCAVPSVRGVCVCGAGGSRRRRAARGQGRRAC